MLKIIVLFFKNNKIKAAVSILAAVALIMLYGTIFRFSAQEGAASSSVSLRVSKTCVEIVKTVTVRDWSEKTVLDYALLIEGPVRKLAHFAEYALMGALIYLILRPWWERCKRLYLTLALWVFVSAAADEFHQFFVADRNASPLDVLLDLCGGLTGAFVLVLSEKGMCKLLKGREKSSATRKKKYKSLQ